MKRSYVPGMAVLTAALSGFCGLIYLVVWDKSVKYHLGADAVSSTITAAACLLGLGAGAYIAGRCDKSSFKTLAWLELAIGLSGALSFYLIVPAAAALAGVLKPTPEQAAGVRTAVVAGSLLLLLPPSALIGGSLPLLFRCFSAATTGLVHGALALGASLGMFILPVLFMNRFDLPAVLATAGGINLALALAVFLWSRRLAAAPVAGDEAAPPQRPLPHALAFVSGFFTIVLCVSLLRAMPIANPSSAYNFPLTLMLFLLALALGSLLLTRGVAENRDALLYRIGWMLCASGLAMFLGIWIASHLQANYYPVSFLPLLEGNYASLPWILLFSGTLIMPAPFFLGAVLPLLLKLHAHGTRGAGGLLLSLFLGACCGLILGRFAGFPLLGTRGLLSFVYLVACGSGTALMVWIWRRNMQRGGVTDFSGALPGGMLALAVMVAIIMPSGIWLTYITGGPEQNWEVREGISGIAQLWWVNNDDGSEFCDVRVNGQFMSTLPFHPRHAKQEIFLLAQPKREKVLMLGMNGAIVRSLLEDEQVKSVDIVEASGELPRLLSGGKAAVMLDHALASPKVRILNADPRLAVSLYEPETFDLVFDDLAFTSWTGSTSIKSAAYYRKIKRILKPGGVFVAAGNYRGEGRLAVLAGLVQTFEIVKEHPTHDVTVIATSKEPVYFDFRIIQVAEPRAAIFGLNYTAPDALAAWFRNELVPVSREQLQGVAPIRDELPVYEYQPF